MNVHSMLDKSKVTLVVNTCDAYQDVWPLFFCALAEYWPDRSIDILLNTEAHLAILDTPQLHTHTFSGKRGVDKWGMRLLETLESIETEYVIVVYDDFILESVLENSRLMQLLEFMQEDPEIAVCYLVNMGLKTLEGTERYGQIRIDPMAAYRLNSAPALWRRKDLIQYTGAIDTPWAWEVYGSYRTYGDGKHFYCPVTADADIYRYNHTKGGAIYRGKWVSEVVSPKNEKYNLGIDLSVRGVSVEGAFEKRTLAWKLQFLWLGFRMVGFKSLHVLMSAIGSKFK